MLEKGSNVNYCSHLDDLHNPPYIAINNCMAQLIVPEAVPHAKGEVGHLPITIPTKLFYLFIHRFHWVARVSIDVCRARDVTQGVIMGIGSHVLEVDFFSKAGKVRERGLGGFRREQDVQLLNDIGGTHTLLWGINDFPL